MEKELDNVCDEVDKAWEDWDKADSFQDNGPLHASSLRSRTNDAVTSRSSHSYSKKRSSHNMRRQAREKEKFLDTIRESNQRTPRLLRYRNQIQQQHLQKIATRVGKARVGLPRSGYFEPGRHRQHRQLWTRRVKRRVVSCYDPHNFFFLYALINDFFMDSVAGAFSLIGCNSSKRRGNRQICLGPELNRDVTQGKCVSGTVQANVFYNE